MSERVLILGAGGFLGPWLVRRAVEAGRGQVAAASRRPEAGLHEGVRNQVELHAFDATAPGEPVGAFLDRLQPTSIILNAALSRIADCERDRTRAWTINSYLPHQVALWAGTYGARLVFVSTDLVFGSRAPAGNGFRESDVTGPLNVYGVSKVAGERAVLGLADDVLVVRLPLLFGPSGGLAAGASDGLVAAVEKGNVPGLFRDELRTPLDVRDAAAALIECLELPIVGKLHVAGRERIDRFELGLRVLRARGFDEERARAAVRETTRAEVGLESERAEDVSLDAARAHRELRTRLRPIDEALDDDSA